MRSSAGWPGRSPSVSLGASCLLRVVDCYRSVQIARCGNPDRLYLRPEHGGEASECLEVVALDHAVPGLLPLDLSKRGTGPPVFRRSTERTRLASPLRDLVLLDVAVESGQANWSGTPRSCQSSRPGWLPTCSGPSRLERGRGGGLDPRAHGRPAPADFPEAPPGRRTRLEPR
jgi:hypothetical protein